MIDWKKELLESKFPLLMGALFVIAVLAAVLVRENTKSEKLQNLQLKNCNSEVNFWKKEVNKKDSFLIEQKKQTDTIYTLLIQQKTINKIIAK
jgi:hypothetical protein